MDLKSIFEAHGVPRTIRAGGNNFTLSAEYPVQALHVKERTKGWLMLSCSYEDAEGQKRSMPFGQARVRAGKVEVRFSGRGLAWKTARALKKLGSAYAPILEKVQAVLDAVKP